MKACVVFVYLFAVLIISTGFVDNDNVFSTKKKGKVLVKENIEDSDGDGIPDNEDDCPNLAGPKEAGGCPDSDGDGIPDHLDNCPNIKGLMHLRGCPDSDGDGIPDHLDYCPFEAGNILNNGCPADSISNNEQFTVDVDFDLEMDIQIQRFEKYAHDQALKKQEYIQYLNETNTVAILNTNQNAGEILNETEIHRNEQSKIVSTVVPVTSQKNRPENNPINKVSPVSINDSKYHHYIPTLELYLNSLKFHNGRVVFADNDMSFEALNKIAAICNEHSNWVKIKFYCYSNNEINGISNSSYRNNQLFFNRMNILKYTLTKKLNVSEQRLDFIRSSDHASTEPNYIKIEIIVE